MIRVIFLISLFSYMLLCSDTCFAQRSIDSVAKFETPFFAMKFSPQHLVGMYPTIQIGLEHRIIKRLSIHYDAGLVINFKGTNTEDYANKRGYKIKIEPRYYFHSLEYTHFYTGLEFYKNDITFDRTSTFLVTCPSGNCSYYQYDTYQVKNQEKWLAFKVGSTLYGLDSKRLFFDLSAGLTFRDIDYDFVGKPIGASLTEFDSGLPFWAPRETDRQVFGLTFVARVAYRLR